MFRLINSMVYRVTITLTGCAGQAETGIVNSISAEGGKGYFNVTLHNGRMLCVYVTDYADIV